MKDKKIIPHGLHNELEITQEKYGLFQVPYKCFQTNLLN